MRRFWWIAVLLVFLALWAWPYAGAAILANAAAAHDGEALAAHIDQPALKRSLARQIVAAYLRKSGRADKMGAFERGLANAVGASVAAPYLDQLLAPNALASLLGEGRLDPIKVGDRTIALDRQVPSLASLYGSHLSYVVLHSFYDGIATFRFAVPADATGDTQYGLDLRLSGLTWRLAGFDLPPDVLDRIAADAVAAEKAGTPNG
jgi:hypothetical protein